MNKSDLVEQIAKKAGLTKKDAEGAIESLFSTVEKTLLKGEAVKISNFGAFYVRERKSRVGVNPTSHKKITIPAAKVVVFKPSKNLKATLRSPKKGK